MGGFFAVCPSLLKLALRTLARTQQEPNTEGKYVGSCFFCLVCAIEKCIREGVSAKNKTYAFICRVLVLLYSCALILFYAHDTRALINANLWCVRKCVRLLRVSHLFGVHLPLLWGASAIPLLFLSHYEKVTIHSTPFKWRFCCANFFTDWYSFAATSRIRSLLTHEEVYPAAALAEPIFEVLIASELGALSSFSTFQNGDDDNVITEVVRYCFFWSFLSLSE